MTSPSNRRHHKAGTGGPSNKRDRKSRPIDDILLDYEKFVSGERTGRQGDEVAVAYQCEVTGSSTSGHTEVSFSRNHSESEGVVPGVKERDYSFLAASGGLEIETGSSPFPSSVITKESLIELVHTFHLPRRHKVLIPRVTDSPTHLPQDYVVISSHHLFAGLRFPLLGSLSVLNLLELTPIQLTLNVYVRLLYFFLIFRRKRIGSPTDNILRHCFQMKKCPKKSLGVVQPDGIYYLSARPSDYRGLLQSDIKSNVGEYKAAYFYITGLGIESAEHKHFVSLPREFLVPWYFVWSDLP
ncbi:hypothetical protein ACOSP7_022360 [Xanthoceras sorbifolium]